MEEQASKDNDSSSDDDEDKKLSPNGLPVLSEEDFKALKFCAKLGYINRLLCTMCKRNKLFPVLFFASMVTRLYYVMFSTFWILYLTSYVGVYLKDDEEGS